MGPGHLGGTDDCSQIMGIGDAVAQHQPRVLPPLPGQSQHILHAAIGHSGTQGDDALMGAGDAHGIQLPAIDFLGGDTLLPGLGHQMAQGADGSLGKIDLVDFPAAAQGLGDGVAPLQHILIGGAGGGFRPSTEGTAFVSSLAAPGGGSPSILPFASFRLFVHASFLHCFF